MKLLRDVATETALDQELASNEKVEAEEATDLSLKYNVIVVPLILILQGDRVLDRIEGADVPALRGKISRICKPVTQGNEKGTAVNGSNLRGPKSAKLGQKLEPVDDLERVKNLINSQPVMLLMKGTPDAPRCGFSSRVVGILRNSGTKFGHFDILSDQNIRQAAKVYSDWPSYPQLYVQGDLVGGCDILEEMASSGELADILPQSNGRADTKSSSLEDRLRALTTSADVVLFMKGSPQVPQCGFSAKVVQALRSQQVAVPFKSFDILQDQEVREGLKKYSQWPTYPQLYAGGELLGGCDIILEYLKQGQLKHEIEAQIQEGRSDK